MKRIIVKIAVLLVVAVFISSSFPLQMTKAEDHTFMSPQITTLSYSFEAPHVRDVALSTKTFSSISLQGLSCYGKPGEPYLPVKHITILLPPGGRVRDISVKGTIKQMEGAYLVEPAGNALRTDSTHTYGEVFIDPRIYNSSELFPGNTYETVGIGNFRGYSLLTLTLYPVHYIPQTRKVFYYEGFTVTIEAEEGEVNSLYRGTAGDRKEVCGMVENPSMVDAYSSLSFSRAASSQPPYHYVLITSVGLENAFQPLIDHKSQFIPARMVNLSYIQSSYSGDDLQERIRNFITDAYQNWNTEYVLLGGDDNVIPHRGFYGYVASTPPEEDDDIPADLYYAALDGTWNKDHDSKWGEQNEADWYAEVYVGRAPVSTSTEATNFVNKVIAFEMADKPHVVQLHQSRLDSGNIPNSTATPEACASWIPDTYTVNKLYEEKEVVTKNKWSTAFSEGRIVVQHDGHGNANGYLLNYEKWNSYIGWYTSDASSMVNSFYPIHTSIACYSGAFDYNDCLAEEYVLNPDGGMSACILNSRYGWYSSTSAHTFSGQFVEQQFFQLFNQSVENLGKMMQLAKETFMGLASSSSVYRWCYYEINLLGDPETPALTRRVYNEPPFANFTYSPLSPSTADIINFTDTSADSNGSIVNWSWDFGDGNSSYAQSPTHSYADDEAYNVTLTVRDDRGATDLTYKHISVANVHPTADAGGPYFASEGEDIDFNGTGSYDTDGTIVSYEWDFDDGSNESGVSPSHSYGRGSYVVRLTVTDDDGASDADNAVVIVGDTSWISTVLLEIDIPVMRGYLENLTSFGPRVTGTASCNQAAAYLYQEFADMGLYVRYHDWSYGGYTGKNIEATINGTDPSSDNIYVACAHYDTVAGSPGADDDGSGVAALLAMARVMREYTFNHTVRFVAFSGEEQGLLGSHEYALDASLNEDTIVGVLNADMLGFTATSAGGGLVQVLMNANSSWIGDFVVNVSEQFYSWIGLECIRGPGGAYSDHWYFWQYGYDAVLFTEYEFNSYYHSPNDVIGTMNLSYCVNTSRLMFATLMEFAVATSINAPLSANFSYSPSNPTADDTITFTDTSGDPDGNITDWTWYFDDGAHDKMGTGLGFNGMSDYITVPDDSSLDLITGITIDTWVCPIDSQPWNFLGKNGNYILTVNTQTIRFGIQDPDADQADTNDWVIVKTYGDFSGWNHIACTYNATSRTLHIYVNGQNIASRTTTGGDGTMSTSSSPLYIGKVWGRYFNGTIDNVHIYTTELTHTQISENYNGSIVTSGLVSEWDFNEGTGTIAYDDRDTNQGTIYGAIWEHLGEYGLRFDGIDDYVNIPDDNSLDLTTGITIATWVKPEDNQPWNYLTKSGNYILSVNTENIRFGVHDPDADQANANGYVIVRADGDFSNWHHIASTYNSTSHELNIFVDGQNMAIQTTTGGDGLMSTSGQPLIIGKVWGAYFNGSINNINLYNIALTHREIMSNYYGSVVTHNLVSSWKFNDGIGTIAYDSIGTNNGTIYGAAWMNYTTHRYTSGGAYNVTLVVVNGEGAVDNETQQIIVLTVPNHLPTANFTYMPSSPTTGDTVTLFDMSNDSDDDVVDWTWYFDDGVHAKSGRGLRFDGSDDIVTIPHHYNLNLSTGITIDTWIKPEDNLAWNFLSKQGSYIATISNQSIRFGIQDSDADQAQVNGWVIVRCDSDFSGWNHIALTYDVASRELAIFVNGVEMASRTTTGGDGNMSTSEQPILIGKVWGNHFNGIIDCLRIYNMSLTDMEIVDNYNGSITSSGLVGWWGFDEGRGTVVYNGIGNNDGTLSGPTWEILGNGALRCDGVDDWVKVRDNPTLDFTTGITIDTWVMPVDNQSWNFLGKNQNYILTINNESIRFGIQDPDANEVDANGYVIVRYDGDLSGWHHVACTYNATTRTHYIYVDGAEMVNLTSSGGDGLMSTAASMLTIGKVWSKYFNGTIGMIRIYDKELSSMEIQENYNEHVTTDGLTSYWSFNEGEGTIAYDDYGGNDATIYGGADWTHYPRHQYASAGAYNIMLVVMDDDRAMDTATWNIMVYDDALLTANFTYAPSGTITINETVTFVDTSVDLDGYIVNRSWDFGEGNTSYGDTALSFDGVNDYVDCGNNASLDIHDGITIDASVNPGVASSLSQEFQVVADRGWERYALLIDPMGKNVTFKFYNGSAHLLRTASDVVSPGRWYSIAGTFDGETVRIYVDGAEVFAENIGVHSIVTSWGSLGIGGRGNVNPGTWAFNGSINSVKIYNTALNGTELQRNHEGDVVASGLVSWWGFDEGYGAILTDNVGVNNGTIYGANWVNYASHKYAQIGTYNTTLTVEDNDGHVDSETKIITVMTP